MDFERRVTARPTRVRDDRGETHTMCASSADGSFGSGLSVGQQLWKEYARVVRNGRSPLYHGLISGGCVVLAAGVILEALNGSKHPTVYILVGIGLLAAGVVSPIQNRRRRFRMAAQLAWFRECLVCAYPIADLEPESDGCTVCPECGAAWRTGSQRPAEA
jgi:hypothetical protein